MSCSVPHTDLHENSPSQSVEPRRLQLRLRGLEPLEADLWALCPQAWEDLLGEYGFTVEAIDLLPRGDVTGLSSSSRPAAAPDPAPGISRRPALSQRTRLTTSWS